MRFASLDLLRFTVKRFRHVCNCRLAPTICRSGSWWSPCWSHNIPLITKPDTGLSSQPVECDPQWHSIYLRFILILSSQPTPTSTKLSLHFRFLNSSNVHIFSTDSQCPWSVLQVLSFSIRPTESPDRPWGPPSLLLHSRYRVFPGGKAAEAWRWPPPRLASRLKKEYNYTSTPLCVVVGCCQATFTCTFRVYFVNSRNDEAPRYTVFSSHLPRSVRSLTLKVLHLSNGYEVAAAVCSGTGRKTKHSVFMDAIWSQIWGARLQVLSAVLLRTCVFWYVTPCRWTRGYHRLEASIFLHLQTTLPSTQDTRLPLNIGSRYMTSLSRGPGSIILKATVLSEMWDIGSGLRDWNQLFVTGLKQYV